MVVQVTPAMRFAAHGFVQRNRDASDAAGRWLVAAVRQAHYAESFPGSYSPELVDASVCLLELFGSFPPDPLELVRRCSSVHAAMVRPFAVPDVDAALSFDECEAAGVDGSLRGLS